MKIELKEITVAELADGYADNADEGAVGYGGRLDIRPPYQREFIYKDAQRDAVIDTLHKGFPLNVMYWAVRGDGNFEVIDGQQRTISICQFVHGVFSCRGLFGVDQPRAFHNLQEDEQEKIRDYRKALTGAHSTPHTKTVTSTWKNWKPKIDRHMEDEYVSNKKRHL